MRTDCEKRLGIQASERAKGCRWHSYLCRCSLGSRIAPNDEGDGSADCIGYSRMVRFRTGVLHLPSKPKRDDRCNSECRSAKEEVALGDDVRSIIDIGGRSCAWVEARGAEVNQSLDGGSTTLCYCEELPAHVIIAIWAEREIKANTIDFSLSTL